MRILIRQQTGFTLAELLIALGLLALIAVFTVPKVLDANTSHQEKKFNEAAKAAAREMQTAYVKYRMDNTPTGMTSFDDIVQYLNYVKESTSTVLDVVYPVASAAPCNINDIRCLHMHSGAVIAGDSDANPLSKNRFGGTTRNHFILFAVDPDGKATSPTQTGGPGKAVLFMLFYDGKIRTIDYCQVNTHYTYISNTPHTCNSIYIAPFSVPPWFSW